MNKFMTTFWHTYLSKVKAKSFIITTVIVMLLIILAGNFDKIMNLFDSSEEVNTVELEASEEFTQQFSAVISEFSENITVTDEDGDMLLTVEDTVPITATVESDSEISSGQQTEIEMALDSVNRQMVVNSLDLTEEEAGLMAAEINVDFQTAESMADTESGGTGGMDEPNY